jgi:hypothetical protein
MVSYIERFRAMANEIKANELLDFVDFKTYPPASNQIFESIEAKIGVSLTESIHNFYGQSNGLQLRWRIKPDITDKELEVVTKKYDDYDIELPENTGNPFAQINIIPLENSFNHVWDEIIIPLEDQTFKFQGMTYPHSEFARKLKPFDLFSEYYCMAFLMEQGVGNPKALLLSNYYAEWNYSRITDFASYIEMLLVTRGIVRSRDKIYSEYRGDLKPPLITGPDYWKKKHIPKLFRKK